MDNRRILIVDDNEDIHADFKKILSPKTADESALSDIETQLFGSTTSVPVFDWEYTVDSAFQGQQALEMVEAASAKNQPYALIFMDVRMPPGWDGIETIKRIWDKFPFTEVILCTAYSDYSSEEIISSLGISHRLLILKKPFDSVVVKHMALASTTKWNLENESRHHTERLERAVLERTNELYESVNELKKTNLSLDLSLKKNQETQQMLIQASKMSALGVMAGGVAHEINTPLATLTLNVELIEDALAANELDVALVQRTNSVNKRITERIAKIVTGLRTFCRDGSHDELSLKPVCELVDETVSLCEEKLKSHGVNFEIAEIPKDAKVMCRSVELSQVLLNLLNNSFDAIIDLPEKWIKIGYETTNGEAYLSVSDSGSGISQEVQSRIFEPFYTTKDVGKGTGLGLSISIGIIASHKGSLVYDSTSPNTKFVIRLPLREAQKAAS